MAQREQRVTPLELFFDLVFVYAITQVTLLMSDDPTWHGLGRGLLVLAALWWAWTGYAWLTNDARARGGSSARGHVRGDGCDARRRARRPGSVRRRRGLVRRRVPDSCVCSTSCSTRSPASGTPICLAPSCGSRPRPRSGPLIIVAAGFFDGRVQAALWVIALAIDYLGALIGRGQGWRVSPAHFAERHGLIVIIALGESIVAIGIGAAGVSLTPSIVTAAVLGIVVVAALWWAYFDVYAVAVQRQLSEASGATRARLARDLYSYLHLPMIAGIVLFALGLKKTIEQVGEPLATVPAVALCGGLSLYFLSHVVLRIRIVHHLRRATTERPGWIGPGRLVTAIAMVALIPAALDLSALTALVLVAGVCCALIAYDVIHYREDRIRVREARP